MLGSALKIMKVVNFISCNMDLLSDQGVNLVIKDDFSLTTSLDPASVDELSLNSNLKSLVKEGFVHHKLDSYLQRSIKDPLSLFKEGLSGDLKQIFTHCPFLFPFSTKELYFKIVSFVSSIDIQRSIYFLRQYLRHNSVLKVNPHEKDNLKKIAKQKVVVNRDNLIGSAF
jgi:hypothetical protein